MYFLLPKQSTLTKQPPLAYFSTSKWTSSETVLAKLSWVYTVEIHSKFPEKLQQQDLPCKGLLLSIL
jgi:hypothetical protein